MSKPSKPPKKHREKSKTRAWEKERRNRLKEYFNKLWEVLPIYDKSNPASKADILIHATSTIKDLDEKIKALLLSPDTPKPSKEKLNVSADLIKKLQDRVRKLLLRNEQLTNLLSNAGIIVPSECGTVKKFKKSPKYANTLSSELQATILQKESEKENRLKVTKPRISKPRLKKVRTLGKSKRNTKKSLLSLPNCLFVVSQTAIPNNSCFIVSKTSPKVKQSVMTNSLLVKAPIVASDIKPSIFSTIPQLSNLGPGTLMFAGGSIMPVVPTPRPLPILPTIITNPVPSQLSTLIVVSRENTNSSCLDKTTVATPSAIPFNGTSEKLRTLGTTSNSLVKQPDKDGLPVLRPRSNITMTTQVNKVPIPALSSKYSKHACLNGKKTQIDDRRKKDSNASINPLVYVSLAKKMAPEPGKNEAKRPKRTFNETISTTEKSNLIHKNASESTNDVKVLSSAAQSREKTVQVNEEKTDLTKQIICNATSSASNSQTLKSSISGDTREFSEVTQATSQILENLVISSNQALPTDKVSSQSLGNNDNGKIMKSPEITNLISDVSTVKSVTEMITINTVADPKLAIGLNKDSFDNSHILTSTSANCSNNYELEAFPNITRQQDITQTESIKEVDPSIAISSNINKSKPLDVNQARSGDCVKPCMDTQTDSLKVNSVTPGSHPACPNSINSKSLGMHMQHDKSCAKQGLKSFEMQAGIINQNNNLSDLKSLEMNLSHAELSNDIFASFHVPPGCQNPESTSPTAAFLLAFPLVSSGVKVAEVMGDENSESQAETPNLLQIGISKPTQSYAESMTPNLLSFENFSFFNNKDNCTGFYNNFSTINTSCPPNISSVVTSSSKTIVSLANNTVMQQIDTLDNGTKNHQPKSTSDLKFVAAAAAAATTVQYNKTESVNIKPSTHNNKIMDIHAKNVIHDKFPNYHENTGSYQTLVAKELAVNSVTQNIAKTVATAAVHVNTNNVLDMSSEVFSFKTASNENYLHNNKSSNSGNVVGPTYTSKSSSRMPDYSFYKNCNSSVSNTFVENKPYPPVYTNAGITNTFYNSFPTESDNRNFSASNCNNYTDCHRKNFTNSCTANPQMYPKEKTNHSTQSKVKPSQSKPINWMTTPSTTASYKADYFLQPFSREPSFNSNLVPCTSFSTLPSNTYFNSSIYNPNEHLNINQDFRKTSDIPIPTFTSYQRTTDAEENQFSWSPNKMPHFLDNTHTNSFVSSTLPTLVGDLALNNTPAADQKNLKDRNRDNRRKAGNCDNQSGQTSFLSVSQLVEPSQENLPAKVASRRNSGNRSKTNTAKVKRSAGRSEPNKEIHNNYQKPDKSNFNISVATNLYNESKQPSRNNTKHIASSYSAEALIGNQATDESPTKRTNNSCQNKAIVPSFFNDNMISYFPSAEIQDTNYMHVNQSHQSNSFSQNFTTTFQNNSYGTTNYIPSSSTITTSYIPTNNFMTNMNTQEFLGDNANLFQNGNAAVAKEKCNFSKNYYRSEKEDKNQVYTCKKAKKRPLNDNVLPSFDIHFFSMPGAVNSPILPDDFHTTYLPPTTLYSCKNPMYSKSNPESMPSGLIPPVPAISGTKPTTQHPQMSPSLNSAGTSLTNFNLSTIFPEINKGPVQEAFSNKDYNNPAAKSIPMSSSLQVPFSNNKSSIHF